MTISEGVVTMAGERTEAIPTTRQAGEVTELRCKRRACATLLASVRGELVVLPDGTRIGPLHPGMVLTKKCPRCGANNVKWLR